MINRRATTYYTLPEELASGKTKEAKATFSMNLVVPKNMEKKAQKFMKEASDDFSKAFQKWMKKQIEKELDD